MQTKTVRNTLPLPAGRAVQVLVMVALFAVTMPFADAVVSGTLSRLGFSVAGTGSLQALQLLFIGGMSASVALCCFACWRVVRS
ncbi:hypothetical protein [Haladaptatus cibarius]|uniref:hypothetical protein n=1 Tax=Haladaptatus cibarius TaxID=453847 RepID=UPI000678F024|nr:hypothetical protein [Haladaptatus cibarius]